MGIQYVVRKATHVGRGHLVDFVNRQDAHSLFDGEISGQHTIIGIICDGCSEGTASEVGASLASAFLVREISSLLELGVSASVVPNVLYPELLNFLRQITSTYPFVSPADRVTFIKNTLLFTVVGFILTEVETVVFTAGDGTIVLNDQVTYIDADNSPSYPAYHLVDRSVLEHQASPLPDGFDTNVYPTTDLFHLAIGSDAWHEEKELIDHIWGFKHPSGLQRRINQWSKTDHRFRDDVTIITVEVVNLPEGEEDHASGN